MFCRRKTSTAFCWAFYWEKITQGPCGVCFMWLDGLQEVCTLVHRDIEGVVRFPQWHALSVSLLVSCHCSVAWVAQTVMLPVGVIYAVITSVLQRISPIFYSDFYYWNETFGRKEELKPLSHWERSTWPTNTTILHLEWCGKHWIPLLYWLLPFSLVCSFVFRMMHWWCKSRCVCWNMELPDVDTVGNEVKRLVLRCSEQSPTTPTSHANQGRTTLCPVNTVLPKHFLISINF